MRTVTTFLSGLALLAPLTSGARAAASPLAGAMHALAAAVTHGDVDEMLEARAAFAALVADAPASPHNQYGLALAD